MTERECAVSSPPREQYSLVYTILAESKGLLGAGGGGGGRRRRAGRHLRSGSGGRVESMVSGMYNVLTSSFLREVCKVKPRLELQTRGKYDEAEPLYREAMEAWRRSARPSARSACRHTLAASINNLGALLQDKWATSLRLSRCTARPWRGSARPRQLASEHAHLPQANNLGALLQKMDDHGGHAN